MGDEALIASLQVDNQELRAKVERAEAGKERMRLGLRAEIKERGELLAEAKRLRPIVAAAWAWFLSRPPVSNLDTQERELLSRCAEHGRLEALDRQEQEGDDDE